MWIPVKLLKHTRCAEQDPTMSLFKKEIDQNGPQINMLAERGSLGHPTVKVWLEVVPLTFARARIIITDGIGVFNSW